MFDQTADGHRRWNGIAYPSRHGDDIQNWAIFEPATPEVIDTADVATDDSDLLAALALHASASSSAGSKERRSRPSVLFRPAS